MTIMQHSSKAQDRTLGVWYQNIEQGSVKLPRFQRFEAWDRSRITSFLNTVINNLPVGVALCLEVAGDEKFVSRFIKTAEPKNHTVTVNQHLLDGQQRLTAFWRAIHNNYDYETYVVYIPEFDKKEQKSSDKMEVHVIGRWYDKNGRKMPLWADIPAQMLERGFVPVNLLRPGDITSELDEWLNQALTEPKQDTSPPEEFIQKFRQFTKEKERLKSIITQLRERVTHYNLPYLSLPSSTPKEVALQVFINMNTNSKPLSLFDIIVAEIESVSGSSLHDLEDKLAENVPEASQYSDMRSLILSTSALLQDKLPNNQGMIEMDKQQMLDNWCQLTSGLQKMAKLLRSQNVFDKQRLPTNAVLAVIAAVYNVIPEHGDFVAKAEKLLKAYLWTAFFTNRYENAAATRAYADYKALKRLLQNPEFTEDDYSLVPILNRENYPLMPIEKIASAKWPKSTSIEARGLLAISNYFGANDFADNRRVDADNITKREYHHLFPDALIKESNEEADSYFAMNCALITWKTNRTIGRADPLIYLKERVELADEEAVKERLKSHLIPYDSLSKAHYEGLVGDALTEKVTADFEAFKLERARLFKKAIDFLAEGQQPSLEKVLQTS